MLFGKRRIQFNVDAFNLMNASTVLARQTRLPSAIARAKQASARA